MLYLLFFFVLIVESRDMERPNITSFFTLEVDETLSPSSEDVPNLSDGPQCFGESNVIPDIQGPERLASGHELQAGTSVSSQSLQGDYLVK